MLNSLFAIFAVVAFAKPGGESILEQRTDEATVYLVEVHREPKGKVDATFAWIPSDVEERCLGKDVRACQELDRCQLHALAQKCKPDLTDCKPVVFEGCVKFGITLETIPKRKGLVPSKLLTTLPYKLSREVETLLKKWEIPLDFEGTRKREKFQKKHSVRARVKWERWTNGENFQIDKFL